MKYSILVAVLLVTVSAFATVMILDQPWLTSKTSHTIIIKPGINKPKENIALRNSLITRRVNT